MLTLHWSKHTVNTKRNSQANYIVSKKLIGKEVKQSWRKDLQELRWVLWFKHGGHDRAQRGWYRNKDWRRWRRWGALWGRVLQSEETNGQRSSGEKVPGVFAECKDDRIAGRLGMEDKDRELQEKSGKEAEKQDFPKCYQITADLASCFHTQSLL